MQNGRVRRVVVVLVALIVRAAHRALVVLARHGPQVVPRHHGGGPHSTGCRARSRSSATATASRRSSPTTRPTCSSPRATCRPRTASTRWTSAATSRPAGCPSWSARAALETDKFVRTLGWRRVAEQEFELLGAGDPVAARGLRARASTPTSTASPARELSLEYAVLSLTGPDYRPEPWTPVDSVAWVKAMAWDLRSNMTDEIDRAHGLAPDVDRRGRGALPRPAQVPRPDRHRTGGSLRPTARNVREAAQPSTPHRRRASLANGPRRRRGAARAARHGRGHRLQLLGGRRQALGHRQADPGQRPAPRAVDARHLVPGGTALPRAHRRLPVRRGRASRSPACPASSSGTTGASPGASARCTPTSPTSTSSGSTATPYEYKGKQVAAEDPARDDQGRRRRDAHDHRPLDAARPAPVRRRRRRRGRRQTVNAVALRWTALTPRPDDLGRLRARHGAELGASSGPRPSCSRCRRRTSCTPTSTATSATRRPGAIPIRSRGDGRWPVPGWDGKHEWKGYVPFEALPNELNPDEGFIVTANNQVVGDHVPVPARCRHGRRVPLASGSATCSRRRTASRCAT